jgi:hypothetical protein
LTLTISARAGNAQNRKEGNKKYCTYMPVTIPVVWTRYHVQQGENIIHKT